MKTADLRNDSGQLTGFSISNPMVTRRAVAKLAGAIPGVTMIRKPRPFQLRSQDDFCEFHLDGATFYIIEPFGDNPEYWIVVEPTEALAQLHTVREAFQR
jgi:hypothetical protein